MMEFEHNWHEFNQQLRAYVARRVDASNVDDILGEILLKLSQHRDKYQLAENPKAWLFHVSANVITDHYRKQSSERKAISSLLSTQSPEYTENDQDNQKELSQCLKPMIQQLPTKYKEALIAVDINEQAQAVAAKQLGISLPAMKSRVQRGRKKLKQMILNCCEVETNKRGEVLDYKAKTSCSDKC